MDRHNSVSVNPSPKRWGVIFIRNKTKNMEQVNFYISDNPSLSLLIIDSQSGNIEGYNDGEIFDYVFDSSFANYKKIRITIEGIDEVGQIVNFHISNNSGLSLLINNSQSVNIGECNNGEIFDYVFDSSLTNNTNNKKIHIKIEGLDELGQLME
jgi:hypothetical protein